MSKNLSVKRTLFTGTLLLTAAGILSRFIGFFYKIFLSRTIGAEGLGIYQLIFPVMALCFSRHLSQDLYPVRLESKILPEPDFIC